MCATISARYHRCETVGVGRLALTTGSYFLRNLVLPQNSVIGDYAAVDSGAVMVT